jgi:hypothetical protein
MCIESMRARCSYIPKISVGSNTEKRALGRLIETRTYARAWAYSFNACNPPKKIEFSQAWLLELCDRLNRPVYAYHTARPIGWDGGHVYSFSHTGAFSRSS